MFSPKLVAHQLFQDPRFTEGKKLLLQALHDHKKSLVAPKDAEKDLKEHYKGLLDDMAALRGTPLYHPYLGSGIGNGPLVELADGSVKYDLISGIGVHLFGHSNEHLAGALIDSALQDIVMQGNLQQNVHSKELMARLKNLSGLDHVFLSTSGAMACENALKVIFQKKYPATRLIAFDGCFMGRTCTLSQITDKPNFREGIPPNVLVDYIPFFNADAPEKSTEASLEALKKLLKRHPGEYAGICFEPVQGERGFFAGSTEFFTKILTTAKDAGLAIFADEVQTFARTYELFAFKYFKLEELVDVVTIGKVSQCTATFWKSSFNPRPGLLSQTFTASTSAIFAANYMLETLVKGDLYGSQGKIATLYHAFRDRLETLENMVQGPFGIGTMIAFTPFKGDNKKVNHFVHKLFENGIIAFVAGSDPTRVRFLLPAQVMTTNDVDPIMTIVERTLKECENEL